jgi:hypothetical protein
MSALPLHSVDRAVISDIPANVLYEPTRVALRPDDGVKSSSQPSTIFRDRLTSPSSHGIQLIHKGLEGGAITLLSFRILRAGGWASRLMPPLRLRLRCYAPTMRSDVDDHLKSRECWTVIATVGPK